MPPPLAHLAPTTLLLTATLFACDDAPPPVEDGGVCSLESASLEVRRPDGSYAAPPGDAELVLGFQGFRYIYVRVATVGEPRRAEGYLLVEIEDEEPLSQPFRTELTETSRGHFVAEPLMVFFNDSPLPRLVGKEARLTLGIGDEDCHAETTGSVVLRYDPTCYEGPTGERICPDGGGEDAGADGAPDAEGQDAGPDGAPSPDGASEGGDA